jgi:hypothetical protein
MCGSAGRAESRPCRKRSCLRRGVRRALVRDASCWRARDPLGRGRRARRSGARHWRRARVTARSLRAGAPPLGCLRNRARLRSRQRRRLSRRCLVGRPREPRHPRNRGWSLPRKDRRDLRRHARRRSCPRRDDPGRSDEGADPRCLDGGRDRLHGRAVHRALAFADAPALLSHAKLGIILGSLASGILGFLVLRLAPPANDYTAA